MIYIAPSSTTLGPLAFPRWYCPLIEGKCHSPVAWQVSLPLIGQTAWDRNAASVGFVILCQSGHVSRRGHHYRRLKPHGSSMLLELQDLSRRGFELTSSRSGVRRSNQIASWPVELCLRRLLHVGYLQHIFKFIASINVSVSPFPK